VSRVAELAVERRTEREDVLLIGTLTVPQDPERAIWFRVPSEHAEVLTELAAPFVVATTMWSMQHVDQLQARGAVSSRLLENLEEFQLIWKNWKPTLYAPTSIRADEERSGASSDTDDEAMAAFSGGVDSAFTAYRHVTGRAGRQTKKLTRLVMAHGFDIPLDRPDQFEQAVARARRMADSLGLELLTVATNLRELRQPWLDSFGTAVAACLHLFAPAGSWGFIASDQSYDRLLLPYGASPVTDHLLSSGGLRIVSDGASHDRIEKIQQLLGWPEALANVRVCWEGPGEEPNCGRCEKCLRTMFAFLALGDPVPPCFAREPDPKDLRRMRPLTELQVRYIEGVLEAARANNVDESWVGELERCVRRNRRPSLSVPSRQEIRLRARFHAARIGRGLKSLRRSKQGMEEEHPVDGAE
jgi:hypothetical protein